MEKYLTSHTMEKHNWQILAITLVVYHAYKDSVRVKCKFIRICNFVWILVVIAAALISSENENLVKLWKKNNIFEKSNMKQKHLENLISQHIENLCFHYSRHSFHFFKSLYTFKYCCFIPKVLIVPQGNMSSLK